MVLVGVLPHFFAAQIGFDSSTKSHATKMACANSLIVITFLVVECQLRIPWLSIRYERESRTVLSQARASTLRSGRTTTFVVYLSSRSHICFQASVMKNRRSVRAAGSAYGRGSRNQPRRTAGAGYWRPSAPASPWWAGIRPTGATHIRRSVLSL